MLVLFGSCWSEAIEIITPQLEKIQFTNSES